MSTTESNDNAQCPREPSLRGKHGRTTWLVLPLAGLAVVGLVLSLRMASIVGGRTDVPSLVAEETPRVVNVQSLARRLSPPRDVEPVESSPSVETNPGLTLEDFEEGEEGSPRSQGAEGSDGESDESRQVGAWVEEPLSPTNDSDSSAAQVTPQEIANQLGPNVASQVSKHIAMFAGGVTRREAVSARVDIYNAQTRKWSTASLSVPRSGPAAVSVGSLALFAGGMSRRGETSVIDVYNADTNKWTSARMSMPRKFVAACAVDTETHKIVVLAGGTQKLRTGFNEKSARVDIYDANRRKWSQGKLSEGRTKLSCVGVGTKIVVAGGYGDRGYTRTVDILDVQTMRWKTARLSSSRQWAAGAASPPLAFFAGGQWCNIGPCNGGWIRDGTVDVYNAETNSWRRGRKMMEARSNSAAASTPGGEWLAYAGGNFNVDPTKYFRDPACRCNCQPAAKFFPAQAKDVPRGGYDISYPRTPARNCRPKRDPYPVYSKSSAMDLYHAATGRWTAARLPMARALNAGAGVTGADGLQLMFAGGEIRTMHQVPTNRGGLDFYTDRVDILCVPGTGVISATNINKCDAELNRLFRDERCRTDSMY